MKQQPIVRVRRVVRRNETCPFCTSGLKFKRCHGKNETTVGTQVAARAAGHPHERPTLFIYSASLALGDAPVKRKEKK